MPKAVAMIQDCTPNTDGTLFLTYTVAINKENGSGIKFSESAPAGELAGLTLAQWRDAAKDRVIADCAGKGITVVRADVSICGGPMA